MRGEHNREWHRSAVFYELIVRSFQDSDNDGIGDLPGLLTRIEYLDWLGVDCIWLLPIFPSPLRDGGYDVSDFQSVHPDLGTLDDLRAVIAAAHRRGMRVIMDMLLNHTSDQHPWFQESRRDPGGEYGDFYVWADDDSGHPDVPVVFCDSEPSNWTFDPVRGQYFWHRFFHHQPDLNYDNPAVRERMLDVVRCWLNLGVDGFRLDAVPYLYARKGTPCAHLPETHAFLKQIRSMIDRDYPGRVLLAEANGSPQEVAAYFGDGDECQLAMHFPLMPRLFLAIATNSAGPVAEAVAATVQPPEGCQWATFARNHDELSLEAVSDAERELMYATYAPVDRMRANVGIRRRLAALVDHNPGTHLLLTSLLLSLPGTPILYYGDEIGMGDEILLADRDAVRMPMQWSATDCGGFSSAPPPTFHLPMSRSPVHGPGARSVESQLAVTSSLLHRTRAAIQARRAHPALSTGDYELVQSDNQAVLAFVRSNGKDIVLCVNNFSRYAQPVSINLGAWPGRVPVELTGGTAFPVFLGDSLILSLGPHDVMWFELVYPHLL